MDPYSDSGELYNIRNQFFTNQFHAVKDVEIAQLSSESQLKALEFVIRLMVALGEDALELINDARIQFPDDSSFFDLLAAWNDFIALGDESLAYFENLQSALFELQAVLLGHYWTRKGDTAKAIALITQYIDSSKAYLRYNELEVFLILVQLHFAAGSFTAAALVFAKIAKFPSSARDNILYQLLESWTLSIKGGSENLNNSYFFYDELATQDFTKDIDARFRILNTLFVLTVQLKHYPEAHEMLKQIEELPVAPNADFIANRIAFDYAVNEGENVADLLLELQSVDPNHRFLLDHEEKWTKFDSIVEKYSAAA